VRVLEDWSLNGAVLHVAYPSARFVPQRVVVLREHLLSELGNIGKECEQRLARRESRRAARKIRAPKSATRVTA
jgi:hypothetical protein